MCLEYEQRALIIISANAILIQEGQACVIDTFAKFICYYRLLSKAQ